jgi:hypothetical protein
LGVKDPINTFCGFFQANDTLNKFWVLSILRILPIYKFLIPFQVKDTLYKFWVLKVKLRDRSGGNGSSIVGGATSVLRGGRTFDPVRTNHF